MLAFSQTKLFSFLLKFWSKILSGKQWGPLKEKSNIAYTHQRQAFTPSATSVAATNPQCKDNPTNQKVCIDGKLCSSIIIMGIKWVPSLDTLAAHAPPPVKVTGKCNFKFFRKIILKIFLLFSNLLWFENVLTRLKRLICLHVWRGTVVRASSSQQDSREFESRSGERRNMR